MFAPAQRQTAHGWIGHRLRKDRWSQVQPDGKTQCKPWLQVVAGGASKSPTQSLYSLYSREDHSPAPSVSAIVTIVTVQAYTRILLKVIFLFSLWVNLFLVNMFLGSLAVA